MTHSPNASRAFYPMVDTAVVIRLRAGETKITIQRDQNVLRRKLPTRVTRNRRPVDTTVNVFLMATPIVNVQNKDKTINYNLIYYH